MKNLYILAAAGLLFVSCQKKEEEEKTGAAAADSLVTTLPDTPVIDNGEMCFLKVAEKDSLMLTVKKDGGNISGVFKSLPYEKDKKTIIFKGSLNGNMVNATGTAMAEDMTSEEEFIFTLGAGKATVKFGEMLEGDDGIWRYKNLKNTSGQELPEVECE